MANTQDTHGDAVINPMFAELANIQRTHPKWYSEFDDANVDSANQDQLRDLIKTSPVDSVRYFLLGKLSMRLAMDVVTGRN